MKIQYENNTYRNPRWKKNGACHFTENSAKVNFKWSCNILQCSIEIDDRTILINRFEVHNEIYYFKICSTFRTDRSFLESFCCCEGTRCTKRLQRATPEQAGQQLPPVEVVERKIIARNNTHQVRGALSVIANSTSIRYRQLIGAAIRYTQLIVRYHDCLKMSISAN